MPQGFRGFQKGLPPWNKGRKTGFISKTPEETRKKLSIVNTGKIRSKESILKYRLCNIGRKHTKETIQKLKESHRGYKQTKEQIEKRASKCRGEKHWRWIEDRSLLRTDRQKMYDTKYKYWMAEVKKRDNWKCKINNQDCRGTIVAHHILPWRDFPELRYNINNGITLCHAHHPIKRVKEKELQDYFKTLVQVSSVKSWKY